MWAWMCSCRRVPVCGLLFSITTYEYRCTTIRAENIVTYLHFWSAINPFIRGHVHTKKKRHKKETVSRWMHTNNKPSSTVLVFNGFFLPLLKFNIKIIFCKPSFAVLHVHRRLCADIDYRCYSEEQQNVMWREIWIANEKKKRIIMSKGERVAQRNQIKSE